MRVQKLDGDDAIEGQMFGLVYYPHASRADRFEKLILVAKTIARSEFRYSLSSIIWTLDRPMRQLHAARRADRHGHRNAIHSRRRFFGSG